MLIVLRILTVIKHPPHLLAVAVAFLCILLYVGDWDAQLRFDRIAISGGNPWSLLTGNFVHLGLHHLVLNLAGFALVVLLVWTNFNTWEWLSVLILSSLAVGAGLYLRDPDVDYYVGFSGTLHGLIMAGTLADFRRFAKAAALLLCLIVAKLAWEQHYGPLPGSESAAGGRVVVNSHFYGALMGALLGIILLWRKRRQKPPPKPT